MRRLAVAGRHAALTVGGDPMRRTTFTIEGPFNPDARCAKCGHDDISAHYDEGCSATGCPRHPERIDRHCRRCHFEWSEAPLNSPMRSPRPASVPNGGAA